MIRNLYVNETLVIKFEKNKLTGIIKRDNLFRYIESKDMKFLRNRPSVMENLKEGKELTSTTDGSTIISSINEENGVGYSLLSSIEDLEFNLNSRRK